jgi:hypothetical protein
LTTFSTAWLQYTPAGRQAAELTADPVRALKGYAKSYLDGLVFVGPIGRLSNAVIAPVIVGAILGKTPKIDKGEVAVVVIETAIAFIPVGGPAAAAEVRVAEQAARTEAVEALEGGGLAGSIRNVNPTGGTTNCVNCSIATDATLAGNAASALPGAPTSIAVLEQHFGGQFVRESGQQAIESALQAAGPGARGIVYGWRTGGIGHVFNAVNQNGVVRFLDGQIGRAASFVGYAGFALLRTK